MDSKAISASNLKLKLTEAELGKIWWGNLEKYYSGRVADRAGGLEKWRIRLSQLPT